MHKKDFKYLSILLIFLIIYILHSTKMFTFLYASKDTYYDLINITNIIRDNTKYLFFGPNYSIILGKDLYNYYNLITNPIIRLSSLFKFIPTTIYLISSTLICLLIIIYLFYKLLRNKHYDREICFISTFLLILSSSFIYHTTHDITNIHFLLFLLLSLHGVDKLRKKNRLYLLSLSIFLMFITNPILSLYSLIIIIIYYISNYLINKKRVNIKSFLKELSYLLLSIILGILMSSRITLPIIYLLINKEISIPEYSSNILYTINSLGITSIIIPALINNFKLNKEQLFNTLSLLLILLISHYINFLLLPFLPLYILTISRLFKDIKYNKINYKTIFILSIIISIIIYLNNKNIILIIDLYLVLISIFIYLKTNIKSLLYIPFILISISNCYINNMNNNLILKDEYNYNKNIQNIINTLNTNDKTPYRISNELSNQNNIFDLILNNNKYLISRSNSYPGYKLIKEDNGINIYQNNNTIPLIYTSNNLMNYLDYNSLDELSKLEAKLNTIITNDISNNNYISHIETLNIEEDLFNYNDISYKDNKYYINTEHIIKLEYNLDKKEHNKIIFISFNLIENSNNNPIIINNILSYNEFILNPSNKITISIYPGRYIIDNIKIYSLDSAYIETNNFNKVDIDSINYNSISASTHLEHDSYLTINLPYNKYYKLFINNEEQEYNKVNDNNIGIYLKKGYYDINITYYGPLYVISILTTMFSIIIYLIIITIEIERKI